MEEIKTALRHAVEAGKLRAYVRAHGGAGLAGLTRLADRHSAAATAALNVAGRTGTGENPPGPHAWGVGAREL